MKILYLIIASNNPEHIQDEISQRISWAKTILGDTIWLRGGDKEFFDEKKQTLFVKISEEYDNILEKTIMGIKWCLENRHFDVLIRSNVSTYFVPTAIESVIPESIEIQDFIGGYIDYYRKTDYGLSDAKFVNGGAIFLNRSAAYKLISMDIRYWRQFPDDFAITRFLVSFGVFPTWIPRGNVSATGILTKRVYYRFKSSNNPQMASIRMQNLYALSNEVRLTMKIFQYIRFHLDEIRNFKRNFGTVWQYSLSLYSVLSSVIKSRRY